MHAALPPYQNFKVAVYCRAMEVRQMSDPAWLEARWNELSTQLHVDKVYLETHRDQIVVPDDTIEAAKAFFAARGVETAGGITYTINEPNRFETFSYSNPEHRKMVREIAQLTARHFDHFILDDFFFTSQKSAHDVEAKGDRTWTEYRLALMTEAAQNLVVGPAREVNPDVQVVIKYPNWYEHFQSLGFNLETEPAIFDGIYTGTETRDAVMSAQHLQPYHGYSIFRYFENIAPGRNGGGWVDTYGSSSYDRYAEQLWLTLFAKAPEITLFDLRLMHDPLDEQFRGEWQDGDNSFDYEQVMKPVRQLDGSVVKPTTYARVAALAFEQVDTALGALGKPVALKSYKPFHSTGEDFLQSYLGMIGLPMEIVPNFPADEPIVLLTEQAAHDPDIVDKIRRQLTAGKKVIITSGLLKQLQDRGIEHIAELRDTGRVASVDTYVVNWELVEGGEKVLIPQIGYRTNDSWELVSAVDGDNGWPLLHDADYLDGQLYVLTVPENFAGFYKFPQPVLDAIRKVVTAHLPVQLEAPSKVSLFLYDNGTFIVENFRDEPVDVRVVLNAGQQKVSDPLDGEPVEIETRREPSRWGMEGPEVRFVGLTIPAHSFRTLKAE